MAPVIPVQAGAHEAVGTFIVEGGSTSPAFTVKYLRFGIWHHFQYQSDDGCLREYVESLGLDYHGDIVWKHVRPQHDAVDLEVDKDIDPRFNRTSQVDVVVTYRRHHVTHSFGFQTKNDGGAWLKRYVEEMLHMKMSDVRIKVLKSPIRA